MNDLTLKTIQLFLSQLANNSNSVYWLGDPTFTNLVYISPIFEEIWGRPRQALYDNPALWITYLHPDDSERHPIIEMKKRVLLEKSHAQFKEIYRIVRPDGTIRWILDRGFTVCNTQGDCIAATGVATDITEERKKEEMLKKAFHASQAANKAKSEFIQNMSHDLRTPLTGLLGVSESQVTFLSDDDPHKDRYGLICDSAKQLQRMFEQILETAGLDYQDSAENPVAFSIEAVVNNVVALLKPSILNKKLDHTVLPLGALPDVALSGHPLMLERVLMNLLGNAIKFTDQGNIAIQYGIEDHTESDNPLARWLTLSVKDSGTGIPVDKQAKIFELFTRLSPSYQGIHEGHGLGLYITKKLVALMNGNVTVRSEGEGKGATFLCKIPVTLTDQPLSSLIDATSKNKVNNNARSWQPSEPQKVVAHRAPTHNDQARYRILLVEDNRVAIKVASSYLERYQCDVTVAQTAEDALALAADNAYDCIFMDVGLPDGDGRNVTRTIRATKTFANGHTPIIGLTAHADPKIRQDCLASGMNAVYNKPLTPQRIETVLNDIVVLSEKTHHAKDGTDGAENTDNETTPTAVIDLAAAAALMQCEETIIYEMLTDVIATLAVDKVELDAVFTSEAEDKWAIISRIAHRIRGACGYSGAFRLQEGCAALEQQFRTNPEPATLITYYESLMKNIAALEDAYKRLEI